jgi:hypothetical protein
MRNTNFITPGQPFTILNYADGATSTLKLYEFTPLSGVVEISPLPTINTVGGDTSNFTMIQVPTRTNENYFVICVWGSVFEVVRIGAPPVVLIVNYDEAGVTLNYNQVDLNGNMVANGTMTEMDPLIAPGLYYTSLSVLVQGFYEVWDPLVNTVPTTMISIQVPYKSLSTSDSGGGSGGVSSVPKIFMDMQYLYGTFAFIGSRFSRYDDTTGRYKDVTGQNDVATGNPLEVRASDFIKVLCTLHGINYDRTQPVNITEFVLRVACFNEDTGAFLNFIPGVTPETSPNNFNLYHIDEFNNVFIRGLQVLYADPASIDPTSATKLIDAPDGTKGLWFPFTNEAFT